MKPGSTVTTLLLSTIFVSLSSIYVVSSKRTSTQKSMINSTCRVMSWFDRRQKRLCVRHPMLISRISNGVKAALAECREQFKGYRWNCSPLTWMQVFMDDGILKKRSRETAFVHAISAAGVMRSLAEECSKGELRTCGCDVVMKKRRNSSGKHQWTWGGCGHNIRFGNTYTKQFMDPKKITNHAKRTKAHNYEVGRKIVRDNYVKKCKCHGRSSSCTLKTCWREVPSIEKVGKELMKRYRNPVKSRWDSKEPTVLLDRNRSRRDKKVKVSSNHLSYFASSEDFCTPNQSIGIMGTSGRVCNSTTNGHDGCANMCCGRRHIRTERTTVRKCKCKFVWCCEVKCEICKVKTFIDTCT